MINKYNKGVIFKLDEKDKQLYLILSNIEKDNIQYLLVMPIDNINKIVIDYTKSFLIKVDENDNLEIVDDKEQIRYVVNETIKQDEIREKHRKEDNQ